MRVELATRRALSALAIWSGLVCAAPAAFGQETLFYADFRPMMMGPDASPDRLGYSVDIVVEAARRIGREVTTEYRPFARALQAVRKRPDAIQVSVFRDPVREPRFRWIARTHSEDIAILTLGPLVNTIDEARSLRLIGVERRSGLDNLLTGAGFTNLERVARPETNAIKLAAGRIDGWAAGRNAALWAWANQRLEGRPTVGAALGSRDVYVAAGLGFPEPLAAQYAEAIEKMRKSGDIEAIVSRYTHSTHQSMVSSPRKSRDAAL